MSIRFGTKFQAALMGAACLVLAAPAGALIEPLAQLLDGLTIREHVPQIEVAVADNATALVLRVLQAPAAQDLEKLKSFAARHAVRLLLQPRGLDSVTELEPGAAPLHDRAADRQEARPRADSSPGWRKRSAAPLPPFPFRGRSRGSSPEQNRRPWPPS